MDETTKVMCRQCSHCCRTLILEILELDVVREPRLLKYAEPFKGLGDSGYLLLSPCPFLKDNKCEIYPTRPTMCVAFEPGEERCMQEIRPGSVI